MIIHQGLQRHTLKKDTAESPAGTAMHKGKVLTKFFKSLPFSVENIVVEPMTSYN